MISILVPTRGRPQNVRRLIESIEATVTDGEAIEVVLYLDDDDPARAATMAVAATESNWPTLDIVVVAGPRVVLSQCWNECAVKAHGDILMHAGDDIVFRSQDWNIALWQEFARVPDHILFVHGRDGIQDATLGTHGFVHRDWVAAVGYLCPPYFSSDWNDTWLTAVADALGRRVYRPDIYTEHLHPSVHKGEWDVTHQERIARGERDNVAALYAAMQPRRDHDAETLRTVIARHAAAVS